MPNDEKKEIFKELDKFVYIKTTGDKEQEKRKCLTYVDEHEKNINNKLRAISIVSFTALKNTYINELETKWIKLRKDNKIPKGVPIHFTSLRTIMNKINYKNSLGEEVESLGWNEEYVLKKYKYFKHKATKGYTLDDSDKIKENLLGDRQFRNFIEQYELWKSFNKTNENGFKILDLYKVNNFFKDLLDILNSTKMNILCTSFIYDKNANHKKEHVINKNNYKTPYQIALMEHLNLLCFYLRHGYMTKADIKKDLLYHKHFTTKLRCDGDDGFSSRKIYRTTFNESITSGTKQFSGDAVRDTIDEIRFINKSEIGYYSEDNEKFNIISHIGCDIADFISYYVSMYNIKSLLIKEYTNEGLTTGLTNVEAKKEAEEKFINEVAFSINEDTYMPYEQVLKHKIINMNGYKTTQLISDCNFLNFE
ncbi:hypothetical protein [Clostridium sp. ZS2-4]|uniref:hypothetical protein n=1 Tax=Clostridium sp. ZS2-4 TaxID=2987703 RepID=UPI00227A382C|nr:hypothetical protein [Clostridium sp. ZS2-4]MCY6355966.1 hypothetical protein [Clostridium sp. ZS2-4]